ncbi:hypothetical protein [Butyricicoccus sp. Marseille-Q5471]|uniref:hypothetical protein n=1 Tax=Butyricicoccus sp. Marseille-Q5471 TaxID=3039493 RepID=UPI0024BD2CC8|nr:hypothetical protein [Butyricicoccus sp. Marseille-Q5471]
MKIRYGIHTVLMTLLLSRKWYNQLFQTLMQRRAKGAFYRDETYQTDNGMEKYICTYYCDMGVVLYLYKQKKHKNKTNRNTPCFMQFRVNPLTLIRGYYSPTEVFQAKKEQTIQLEAGMNQLLKELELDKTFEELKLSRVDCCLDWFPKNQACCDELLRIVRRSPYTRSYREMKFPNNDPRHKQKNEHSWRIQCKTVTLTVYDKAFQLLEEELIEEPTDPMLRIEVSRSSASFKRGLSDEVKGSNCKILKTIMDESETTIAKYLKSVNTGARYVKYEHCLNLIDSEVKNVHTRGHMKQFAEKLSKCKSYAQAVENSGLSESQIKTVRGQFRKFGISPITLRNNAEVEKLHFPGMKW